MLTSYDFFMPPEIVFGWGRRTELGARARRWGDRAFVVWGSRTLVQSNLGVEIVDVLQAAGIDPSAMTTISHEPLVADVDSAVAQIRNFSVHPGTFVLAIGGGSAIDLGKAVAALATNTQGDSVRDYLEGVGRGLPIAAPPLPVVSVPTTAGTGSEATKNAVISSYDPPFKKSLRADSMVPRLVVVDPELTVSLPPAVTAQTGMDAITQLIESYISRRAKPLPQSLVLGDLKGTIEALPLALRDGTDRAAREAMAHGALVSGIALANSGLGLAHGVAAALGIHARVSHGLACAVMLPVALRANQIVAEKRLAQLGRAIGLGGVLGSGGTSDTIMAEAFIERVTRLAHEVGMPDRLSELGVRREQLPDLVRDSRGNSMSGNPRDLDDAELTQLLEEIW